MSADETAGLEPSKDARPPRGTPERRIFVGDVQGCRAELERLLERVRFDPARDALHPVGDLVNRGPDSLGVLRLARALDARAVLGNHDVHLLRVSRGTRALGERDTLDAVLAAPDSKELLAWLAAQPFVRASADVLQVHAGLHPDWTDPVRALARVDPFTPDERSDFATRVRTCDAAGARPAQDWPPPPAPFGPWYDAWRARAAERGDARTVCFGHWARAGLVVQPGLRGLDTGCVWGGRLTAWIAEDDRLVSVDAEREWSPRSRD